MNERCGVPSSINRHDGTILPLDLRQRTTTSEQDGVLSRIHDYHDEHTCTKDVNWKHSFQKESFDELVYNLNYHQQEAIKIGQILKQMR